ncbi:MAG: LacI family transcriptional regulator, partial [Propionibacteriaceae bacterium]|nr:LacI family transcriptional regulator [Propionibacteriaceae bacterium]
MALTQKELAKRLGVSRSLVSMALSDSPLVAAETRERIQKEAAELGYVRDMSAANLAAGRSTFVGVLLPDLRNPFLENIVEGIETSAVSHGLLAFMATGANSVEREHKVIDRFREQRAAGVIAVSPAASPEDVRALAKQLNI